MKKKNRGSQWAALLLAAIITLTASAALAGNFQWTPVFGIAGGEITSLAYNPADGRIYAGTYGGGVSSRDPADPFGFWYDVNSVPGITYVNAVRIDVLPFPLVGNGTFACTEGGVFNSEAGLTGYMTWRPFTSLVGGASARTTGIVYDFGTDNYFVSTNGGGVWRGTFNAASQLYDILTQENTGLVAGGSQIVHTILNDGAGNLFIATDNGVYSCAAATDPLNWTSVSANLNNSSVLALITDGANLYAGTNGGGFYWAPIVPPPGALFWTRANGATPNILGGFSVRALDIAGGVIYAATNNGAYSTADTGANWLSLNGPQLNDAEVGDTDLTAVTASGGSLVVGAGNGVFLNIGLTNWVVYNDGLNTLPRTYAFAVSPAAPSAVYAATSSGVYKSTDYGSNWVSQYNGMGDKEVTAIAVSNVNPNILFAGTYSGVIYKSTNGGASWVQYQVLSGRIYDIKFSPFSSADVWLGGEPGLYHSNGGSFKPVNKLNGDPDEVLQGVIIYSISIDPKAYGISGSVVYPLNIYVGINVISQAFARTSNGGMKWELAGSGITPANSRGRQVLVDPVEPDRLYLVCGNDAAEAGGDEPTYGGINVSNDKGDNFILKVENNKHVTFEFLAIDPAFHNKIYAVNTEIPKIGGVKFTHGTAAAALNDMTATAAAAVANHNFTVTIDSTFGPDTFSWTDGVSSGAFVPITGVAQLLTDGVSVTFTNTTGHLLGSKWVFSVTAPATVSAIVFTAGAAPPELNDMSVSGVYTADFDGTFTVEITAVGTPDIFKWELKKKEGGDVVNGGSGIAITGLAQDLDYGVFITFANTSGHTVGDKWEFDTEYALQHILYTNSYFGNITYSDSFNNGLPQGLTTETIAVNPQFPNILLTGTVGGPYEYEGFYLPAETVTIKNGDSCSKSTAVNLSLTYRPTAKQMHFSNDLLKWSGWVTAVPTAKWNLSKGSGPKTVWVEFKDQGGFTTRASDTITLDASKPLGATITFAGLLPPADTFGAAQPLLLAAVDNNGGCGIKDFRLSNTSMFKVDPANPVYSDWFPFSSLVNPITWNLKQGGGALRVYGQFRDFAGNVLQVTSVTTNNGIGLNNVFGPPTFLNAVQNDPVLLPTVVSLNWDDNSDNETSFVVERAKLPSTTYNVVATLKAPSVGSVINSYTDNITAGPGNYQYRIRVLGNGINITGPTSVVIIVP